MNVIDFAECRRIMDERGYANWTIQPSRRHPETLIEIRNADGQVIMRLEQERAYAPLDSRYRPGTRTVWRADLPVRSHNALPYANHWISRPAPNRRNNPATALAAAMDYIRQARTTSGP